MRVQFTDALHPILSGDDKSVFLTGDVGFNAFEKMQEDLGDRFINAGVAEQNMVGVSAGLALQGFKPWAYSIAPFATFRCLEQIRNDVCLHNLPVKIVGNGGGFTYGIMGSTHHALEDLAVLKAMPNMNLFFPCLDSEVKLAVEVISEINGPCYLRLAISGYKCHQKYLWQNGKTLTTCYKTGSDVLIIGVGHGLQIALQAHLSGELPDKVAVFGISRFPLDFGVDKELSIAIKAAKHILLVEEHYKSGGIGESIRSSIETPAKFQYLNPYYSETQRYGGQKFHLNQCNISPQRIIEYVQDCLND